MVSRNRFRNGDHNFFGAMQVYPEAILWNTIPEFIRQVTSTDYEPLAYRDFRKIKRSLRSLLHKIDRFIVELVILRRDDNHAAAEQPNCQDFGVDCPACKCLDGNIPG